MRVLLTGPTGQVGTEFSRIGREFAEIIPASSHDLDLSIEQDIRSFVRDVKPDIIVNAAAFTAVDAAEQNWDACFAVNAMAPVVLAEEAHRLDALLVHYSTDYVFDGSKAGPYTEDDPTSPLNVYGASKAAGEEGISSTFARALILRTSWLYSVHGQNFLLTILRLARQRAELKVVSDQIGAPTSARSIALATSRVIRHYAAFPRTEFPAGTYHLSAAGETSWYGFASAIVRSVFGDGGPVVTPILTGEVATLAKRPKNSMLSSQKFAHVFGFRLAHWEEQLEEVLSELDAELKLPDDISAACKPGHTELI